MDIETAQKAVLANFGFERVHKTMVALDWGWATASGLKVPDEDEIKLFVIRLIRQAFEERKANEPMQLSGGGFSVAITEESNVEVQFVVESCRVI